MTATAQSLIEAVAFKVAGRGPDSADRRMTQRAVVLVGDVAAMGLGVAAQKLLAHRKDEPIARAWARTFSWRIAVGGMAGAIIVTGDMLLEAAGDDRRSWTHNVPVALPLGAGLAAWQYHRLRSKMVADGVTHDAEGEALDDSQGIAVGKAVAVGAGVSLALYAAATGEKLFAHGVGSVITSMNPRAELIGRPVGHAAAFGLLGFAGFKGLQHVFASAESTRGRRGGRVRDGSDLGVRERGAAYVRCRWTPSGGRVAGS